MDSLGLDEFLTKHGVKKDVLRSTLPTTTLTNKIAEEIGDQWERLAPIIGVGGKKVEFIKRRYSQEPLKMRLVMMRRWHKLGTRKATYIKLVEGLWQIGRKDLIEVILGEINRPTNVSKEVLNSKVLWLIPGLIIIVVLSYFSLNNAYTQTSITLNSEPMANGTFTSRLGYFNESSTVYSVHNGMLNSTNKSCNNIELPNGELPKHHEEIFVGREIDVVEVLRRVTSANIVNINGAPGFGKSALAKQVGNMILKNGKLVQYVNTEDKLFYDAFKLTDHDSEHEVNSEFKQFKRNTYDGIQSIVVNELGSSLVMSSFDNNNNYVNTKKHQHHFIHELLHWSESINCHTVLILDNCDDLLDSPIQNKFSDMIKSLVRNSHFKLHVIITSRLKLLYTDWFDSWTVKELDTPASIELLDKMAPGIDADNLKEIAEVVQGCPLALKVVGQLLHIYGKEITHKLKDELMILLDDASDKRERFPVIMDVAFSKLGELKECGYSLSLFPGSFDKSAANAIIVPSPVKGCIQLYSRHSLVDEYFIPHQQRYEMHRLIREYLKAKILPSDKTLFKRRFKNYFMHVLLTYAKKTELDSIVMNILSSEVHNLHYLRALIFSDDFIFSQELSVLAFLVNFQNLVHDEDLQPHYPLFMMKINDVCKLLNPQLCGQLYSQIVKHLYQQCKCETFTKFINNFYISPCMEHFQCDIVQSYFKLLKAADSEVDLLPQVEKEFLCRILHSNCRPWINIDTLVSGILVVFMVTFSLLELWPEYPKLYKILIIIMAYLVIQLLISYYASTRRYSQYHAVVKWTCQTGMSLFFQFFLATIVTLLFLSVFPVLLKLLCGLIMFKFRECHAKLDCLYHTLYCIFYTFTYIFSIISITVISNYLSVCCCQFIPICL